MSPNRTPSKNSGPYITCLRAWSEKIRAWQIVYRASIEPRFSAFLYVGFSAYIIGFYVPCLEEDFLY